MLFRKVQPNNTVVVRDPPPTPQHLELRELIEQLIKEAEATKLGEHWYRTPIEDIIHACRLSFAKEVGERIAMKFIED